MNHKPKTLIDTDEYNELVQVRELLSKLVENSLNVVCGYMDNAVNKGGGRLRIREEDFDKVRYAISIIRAYRVINMKLKRDKNE